MKIKRETLINLVRSMVVLGILALMVGAGGLLNNQFRADGEFWLYREDAVLEILLPLLAIGYVTAQLAIPARRERKSHS